MEHGSLVNVVLAGSKSPEPEVGMGVTILSWTDRNPGTIVALVRYKGGAKKGQLRGFIMQHDEWKVVSGSEHDGSARYEYTPDPTSPPVKVGMTRKGWRTEARLSGDAVVLGHRERYHDPSL